MRFERSFLLFAGLGVCALTGLVACSADGDGGEPDQAADAAPADDASVDATRPDAKAPSDAAADRTTPPAKDNGGVDASKPDTAVTVDAGLDTGSVGDASDASDGAIPIVDAGPDVVDASYDPVGSACPTSNAVQTRLCGRCGTEKRLCWPQDGGSVWLDWGPCQAEKADAGLPNTQVPVDCEMCGKKVITYDSLCNASVGFCQPAPGAQCEKGAAEWAPGLSCSGDLGRLRTCDTSCKWEDFSDCQTFQNPNKLSIATLSDAGSNVVSATFRYVANPKIKRLLGASDITCPITATGNPVSDMTVYAYVEVRNPTAKTAVVSLWHSAGDSQMAVYAGSTIPADDAARRACMPGTKASDSCPATMSGLCGQTGMFSTAGVAAVTVPANGSITVYNTLYSTTAGAGPFLLSVRTDSLQ